MQNTNLFIWEIQPVDLKKQRFFQCFCHGCIQIPGIRCLLPFLLFIDPVLFIQCIQPFLFRSG